MRIISGGNSTVQINGVTYEGNNVSIVNGKVVVDGKTQEQALIGNIEVIVHGNPDVVESMSGDVTVHGNIAGSVNTMSGNVVAKAIGGSVSTMSGNIVGR
jgi:hypothetical protein